jgi:cyclopropane fatty-acyl-phospholipid synthase-like methyltransferase
MERVLRGGEPADLLGFVRKDDDPLLFQRAMAETAAPIAEWIAGEVPVAGRARAMLDIGGSHGLYSAALCRHHPPMRADILELPEMIPSSRRVAQEWGAEEYVSYIEGDVKTLRLSGRYDLVFLGNILHHFSEERVTSLLETLAAHLSSGGTAVVWDLQTPDESADEVSAAFSLFFYLSSGSGCHSEERMREMLRTAGFSGVRSHRPPGPSTHLLYTARAGGGQET